MNSLIININTTKNLLAFSAGVDSTALFFLMVEQNIPFDIAIVDYNQREQSKDEVIYATQLAHRYNKKCFISTYPEDLRFSEKDGRDFRHNFFDEIINKYDYEALVTAHQLDDKLEWFLMQLTKGAGLSELLGMQELGYKNSYKTLKPLLKYSKESLEKYLIVNKIKYFVDVTNSDQKYKRNYFRHNFTQKLLQEYENGILNSFEYLENDLNSLFDGVDKKQFELLSVYSFNGDLNVAIRLIDKELKTRGIIISANTRDEILKQKEAVVSHKIAVSIRANKIYIAPYIDKPMDKKFKERCRVAKIPKNIRSYISTLENIMIDFSSI